MSSMESKPQILVLGGGSLVGHYLLPMLADAGYRGYVVSRKPVENTGLQFEWLPATEVQDASWRLHEKAVIISLWPIWLVGSVMPQFLGAAQLIALSSTSLFGKAKSMDPQEKELVDKIAKSEEALRVKSETFRIPHTILRPTLIYDGINDQSITFIAHIIKRLGFFLVAGDAAGLRQPIHAEDVAIAIVKSIGNEKVYGKSLNITGGETITYFTMIRRVSESLGKRVHILPFSKLLLKSMLYIARTLNLTDLSPSLFDRMNQDLAYDGTEAVELLDLKPRDFFPEFPEKNT